MKIRPNVHDNHFLYIEPENKQERRILDDMWRNGVVAFTFGSSPNAELGICSKTVFGSGVVRDEATLGEADLGDYEGRSTTEVTK